MTEAEDIHPRDARKLAAYERLHALAQPPLVGLIEIPVLGTLLGQALRLWYARSVFVTAREDALSGVSNQRLAWTMVLTLGSGFFLAAILWLYALLSAELPPARLWVAQVWVGVFVVLGVPYLIEGLGVALGTVGHVFGGARRSLHMRMNQFHKPTRNVFSPPERGGRVLPQEGVQWPKPR